MDSFKKNSLFGNRSDDRVDSIVVDRYPLVNSKRVNQ